MIHCGPFNERADGGISLAAEQNLASGRACADQHLSNGPQSPAHERGIPLLHGFRIDLPVVTMNSPQQRPPESCREGIWATEMNKLIAQEFWNWFNLHQAELFDFEADQERIFDQLATELQKVDADLIFEFGPREEKREFVVSAGGIKRAFPAVSALVNAAPTLDRWRVTAFRPRRVPTNIVEFRGKSVDPNDVQFSLLDNGKTAGIYLFIPGFQEDDTDLKQIGYLLLDDALGEYDVEERLGLIKMMSPDTPTDFERYPLSELPTRFDQLTSKLEGRSGKAS